VKLSDQPSIETITLALGEGAAAFHVYPWPTQFAAVPGVFVLSRLPHASGIRREHEILYVGETGDLSESLRFRLDFSCFANGLVEYVAVHPVGSEEVGRELAADLVKTHDPPCNRCWAAGRPLIGSCPL